MFRADRWLFEPSENTNAPYDEIIIEEARQGDGTRKYKVRRGDEVFSKTGSWDYEPRPSSRDDEYLKDHRFDTLEKAQFAVEKFWRNCGQYGKVTPGSQ